MMRHRLSLWLQKPSILVISTGGAHEAAGRGRPGPPGPRLVTGLPSYSNGERVRVLLSNWRTIVKTICSRLGHHTYKLDDGFVSRVTDFEAERNWFDSRGYGQCWFEQTAAAHQISQTRDPASQSIHSWSVLIHALFYSRVECSLFRFLLFLLVPLNF